jgi:hypothetical protein
MTMRGVVHIYEHQGRGGLHHGQRIHGHPWVAQCGDRVAYGVDEHAAFWALVRKFQVPRAAR